MPRPNKKKEALLAKRAASMRRYRDPQRRRDIVDFAELIHHTVSGQVTAAAKFDPKNDAANVAPHLLRGLMAAQKYKDSILQELFVLPPELSAEKSKERSWRKWQDSLPLNARNQTPALVRVDPEKPWGPGNMIFIPELWVPLYTQAGSLANFNILLNRLAAAPGVVLPTAEDVLDAASKIQMAANPPPGVIPNDA